MLRTLPSACSLRGTTIIRGRCATIRGTIVSIVEYTNGMNSSAPHVFLRLVDDLVAIARVLARLRSE